MLPKRYEIIETFSPNKDFFGCPAKIEKYAILRDNAENKYVMQLKLQNLSVTLIDFLSVKINYKTENGIFTETSIDFRPFTAFRGYFGSDRVVSLSEVKVVSADVYIEKAILSDGTVWDYNGEDGVVLIPQKELPAAFKKELSVAESLDLQFFEYFPHQEDSFWQCICGKANRSDVCSVCKQSRKEVFEKTDSKKLSDSIGIRLKEELEIAEKENAEQQIQKEKTDSYLKRILFISIAVFIACVLFWVGNKVFYTLSYNSAVKTFEKQKYSEAVKEFNALPQKIYSNRICDIIRKEKDEIHSLYKNKKISYTEATKALQELKEYENIDRLSMYDPKKEKHINQIDIVLEEMKNLNNSRNEFSKGQGYLKEKKYKDAIKALEKIKIADPDYKEAQRIIGECKLTITKEVDKTLKKYKEEKNYSSALKLLEKEAKYIIRNDEINNMEVYFEALKQGEKLLKEGVITFTSRTKLYNDIDGESEYYLDASFYDSTQGKVLEYQITEKNTLWVKVDIGEIFWIIK